MKLLKLLITALALCLYASSYSAEQRDAVAQINSAENEQSKIRRTMDSDFFCSSHQSVVNIMLAPLDEATILERSKKEAELLQLLAAYETFAKKAETYSPGNSYKIQCAWTHLDSEKHRKIAGTVKTYKAYGDIAFGAKLTQKGLASLEKIEKAETKKEKASE